MHRGVVLSNAEGEFQPAFGQPSLNAAFRLRDVLCEEMNLRQNGLAGEHLRREQPAFAHGPPMILILAVEKGDERSGVNEDALHRP
jgi:hypothetical protein